MEMLSSHGIVVAVPVKIWMDRQFSIETRVLRRKDHDRV